MKSVIRRITRDFPGLLILIMPVVHVVRSAVRAWREGPPAESCLRCFGEIEEVSDATVQSYLEELSRQEHVTFVQIGSNDGKTGDPLFQFVSKSRHWTGVLVEPVGFLHERLRENYSARPDLSFERVIISTRTGEVPFYYVGKRAKEALPDLPPWHDQLGNFAEHHIIEHLGERIRPYIECEMLQAVTLRELFDRNHVEHLDLLHIDTEGHDLEILRQLDLTRIRPKVIMVEWRHTDFHGCREMVNKLRGLYKLSYNRVDLIARLRDVPGQS